MTVGDVCVRDVIICSRTTTICEAAQLMLRFNVGDAVVVEESKGKRIPLGIVTDRDIVVGVVALKLNPALTTAGDVMKKAMITGREDHGVFETVQHMRMQGIRRIPVVNGEGALVGILSIDDVIQLLAEEMTELARLVSKEQPRL